jgi:GH25 family lysozyme M1 (1,4-beta-N-acetylmuramidase)
MTSRLNRGLAAVAATVAFAAAATFLTATPAQAAGPTYGQDVSSHQGNVNWSAQWSAGSRFAYVKATEGTYYTNPYFAQQYNGSYNIGMIRGSYHFATPNTTSGATQADYFIAHGGGWSRDGKTLPGALDIEYNPYGSTCYGLSQASMRSWIASFVNQYHTRTGRWATIYTTTDWWVTCTGNYSGFWANNPLWIARYSTSPGTLPAGAPTWSFWQYSSSGPFAGDSDKWNGDLARLKVLACNGPC